jgi:DNA polymerase-3 subunit epsilon
MQPASGQRASGVDPAAVFPPRAGEDLRNVTFVVIDLETTGGSPGDAGITEVGAARFRGGDRLGTLSTLVDPGEPIAPLVTALTGISDTMVAGAPPVAAVLPSLLEFIGDGVVVGHNVRFDLTFLNAALEITRRPPLANPTVDTLPLARCLLVGEVANHRLGTIAQHLRASTLPTHRALPDALATADVLHALLERAATYGVTTLGALMAFAGIESRSDRPAMEHQRV